MIDEYKRASANIGKEVRVITKDGEFKAVAEDISCDGHLMIKRNDGRIEEITSGEVSVRGIYEYI